MKLIIHYLTGLAVYGLFTWFGFWLLFILVLFVLNAVSVI